MTIRNATTSARYYTQPTSRGQDLTRRAAQTTTQSAITPITDALLERTQHTYRVADPQAIRTFLSQAPALATLLDEAPARIAAVFGKTPLLLTLDQDPEEAVVLLAIQIETDLPVTEALARLDQLDHEWWLGTPLAYRRHALITVAADLQ